MAKLELHQLFKLSREMQNIGQSELIDPVGKKQPSLSGYEKKGKGISPEILEIIAPIIHINKQYISNRNANPFSSSDLIKMFFVESMLGKIDYDFIRFLYTANKHLDVLFLYPPVSTFIRFVAHCGEFPVYAIVIKDGDRNVFLFRRRNGNILITSVTGTENIELEISEQARKDEKKVSFNRILINNILYEKIQNWTEVVKKDIEQLFLPENQIPVLSEKEHNIILKLIRNLRSDVISLDDIERFVDENIKAHKTKKRAHR